MIDAPPQFDSKPPRDLRAPTLGNPLRYVIRSLDAALAGAARKMNTVAGERVLDYGCGDRHHRKLLAEGVDYVGVDLPGNPLADAVMRPDGTLPFEAHSFDGVISTQVLEHTADPGLYLSECRRVLKPGRPLLLSTHGTMYYHRDPVDYWRWTHDGLKKLLDDSGFDVVHFKGVLGLAAVGIQLFQAATYWKVPGFLRGPYAAIMQGLVGWFDRRYTDATRIPNALVYVLVAESRRDGTASTRD